VAFVNQKDEPSGRTHRLKKELSEVSLRLMSFRGRITSFRVRNLAVRNLKNNLEAQDFFA
jgi:hypothetical protein